MRRSILLALLLSVSGWAHFQAHAAPAGDAKAATDNDPEPDFDSLGGNSIMLDRAKALEPDKRVTVVQKRTVERRNRVELAPEFSGTFGGEALSRTKSAGLNAYYHITPRISLGAKYNYHFNTLTPEGNEYVDRAIADYNSDPGNPSKPYPQFDYAKQEWMGLANWYPIYGKLNWLERSVVQFDVYALGGAGQVTLKSGAVPTWTAGGGIGFWVNKHFSTRFEMRYQTYTAKYFYGDQDLDLTIGSVQMGWIL